MIEAVIFDVGGVLHIYDGQLVQTEVISGLSITLDTFRQVWVSLTNKLEMGLLTEEEYWEEFKKATGSTVQLPEESLLVRGLRKSFHINTEVIEIVRRLKKQGFKLAVLSNTILPHTRYMDEIGLYDLFDRKLFSYDIGAKKPDPRTYQAALAALDISPTVGVFIDDREENVTAANQLGLNGLVYTTAEKLREDFSILGIHV
ncbi:MAG: HAD family phosphatase [Candidatus Daviesbacteria bacterium]|nr:MAG: HAD family phosphatase [Candidatus Daviesbacteria bacterium]